MGRVRLGGVHDGQTLGEICVRGNVVMKGYFRDVAETDKAIVDGWFHTGDAAVMHPDGYTKSATGSRMPSSAVGKHLVCGSRERIASPRCGAGGLDRGYAASKMGRSGARVCGVPSRRNPFGSRAHPICA